MKRLLPLLVLSSAFAAISLAEPPAVDGEWPRWRGPFNNGLARGDAPLRWSDTENVQWKAEIPGRGHSSPVIWKDRIFLTTAVPTQEKSERPEAQQATTKGRGPGGGEAAGIEHSHFVMAFDRATGKKLWQKEATRAVPHEGYHRQYGSFASNSPVTDGQVLITYFGSRGVYAYDLDGNLKWSKDLGDLYMRLAFGEGTAPVLEGDMVLINFDGEQEEDFLVALNKNTGEEIWRAQREEISNWAEPLVVEHKGQKQVIVSAPNKVRSYELESGKLIWECAGLGANTIPAPVSDGEMVWVMSGFRDPNLLAIKLDGAKGDITGSENVVWTNQRGNSYTPSPVLHEGILYFLTDRGLISAVDAKTGEAHYQEQRLPGIYSFKSSLVGANGKLYMASEQGDVIVLKMGKTFEVLATNSMGDEFFIATPAFADGEIYIRGTSVLYKIAE